MREGDPRIAIAVAGLFASWIAACTSVPAGGQRPEASSQAAAGAAQVRVEVRAPIVRVSVRVAESFPPQYFADVTSGLPDGCTEFGRFAVRREAFTVFVDVFNTRPAGTDVVCTMIYGEKETAVALGSEFTPGRTYTLDVNGTGQTFVAQ